MNLRFSPSFLPLPLCSLVFALSFVGFIVAGNPVFGNPDVAWHLAAGDLILMGGIPKTEPWSFTAGATPWYNISWLWDILLSVVHRYGGVAGLYALSAASASAVLAALAYTLKRRIAISDLYILIALLLIWYVLLSYLYPQPWMATLFFAIIFHHLLHKSRSEPGYRALLPLPLLMVFWVNMHGGFLTGFSLIAIYLLEAWQKGQRAWLKRLAAILLFCGFASFMNPYHVHIIDAVLRTMHSVITPYLADWHPITIGNETGITLLLLFFLCVSNLRDVRIPLADRILTLLWLIYALHTRRNFMLFAVLGAPYIAWSLQEFARHAQGATFKTINGLIPDSPSARLHCVVFALAVSILAATVLVPAEKLNDDPYRLRTALQTLDKAHFLNNYNLGGHLIYIGDGKWPVFVDGRAGTAYPEGVLNDYITLANQLPGYETLLANRRIDGLITFNDDALARMAAAAQWKRVHHGEFVSVYLRRR